VTELSLFGKLAAPLAGLKIVQWPGMTAHLKGATYCSPFVIRGVEEDKDRNGIVVTVGTIMPFDRLVGGVELLIVNEKITDPVAVQTGRTEKKFTGIETFETCSYEELNERMKKADIVICHGGSGSILGALKSGAHVVAMARRQEFGEHYDNHQKDITNAFLKMDLISVAKDEYDLARAIEEARARPRKIVEIDPGDYLKSIKSFIARKNQET
jgi:UDP-N-acetylglucosamine transferase subunit ALG13